MYAQDSLQVSPDSILRFSIDAQTGLTEGSHLASDAAHLLKKPFSGRELAAKIREVLESGD